MKVNISIKPILSAILTAIISYFVMFSITGMSCTSDKGCTCTCTAITYSWLIVLITSLVSMFLIYEIASLIKKKSQ